LHETLGSPWAEAVGLIPCSQEFKVLAYHQSASACDRFGLP